MHSGGRWRLQDAKARRSEPVRLANRYPHFTEADTTGLCGLPRTRW